MEAASDLKIQVKSKEEIERWLADHHWYFEPAANVYLNPLGPGGFTKDMFKLCMKVLQIRKQVPKFQCNYAYVDYRYGYGWLRDWVEEIHGV